MAQGVSVWCVCLGACMLRGVKSTTRLGLPSALGLITMRWLHVTGSLTGTFSSTPSLQSRSSPLLTSFCQWRGTWLGVWTATGIASSLTNMRSGGELSMSGKVCFSQQLKALLLYLSKMYFLRFGKLAGVGAQGICGRLVGGSSLTGHWHAVSLWPGTPVLEQGWSIGLVKAER